MRDVDAFAGAEVDNHPNRADVAQHGALLVGNHHVTLREVAVVAFNPGGEGALGVDLRVAFHLDGDAREDPHSVFADEAFVADVPTVGMQRGNVDDAVEQHRQWHLALGVALAGTHIISFRIFLHIRR